MEAEPEPKRPTVGASLGAKLNMGNYESQDISIWLTGVPVGATQEYIDSLMPGAIKTTQQVVNTLAAEMGRILKEEYGR